MNAEKTPILGLALRSALSRWLRLVLTVLSISAGVAFFTGASIVSGSLRSGFSELFAQFNQGVDYQVRTQRVFGDEFDGRATVDESVAEAVSALPGVDRVVPVMFREVTVLMADGSALAPAAGPSALVALPDPPLAGVDVRTGRPPRGSGEAALDTRSAKLLGLEPGRGETFKMVSRNDTYEFTLVATIAQAGAEDYLGSVIVGLDPAVAADIAGTPGRVDALAVVLTADASSDSFVLAASGVLPAGVEAVASSVVVDEQLSVLNRFLDPFSTVLVGFSFVALFIAAFIVTNTFNISVSQRLRELAMLRAVGAGPTQVALLVSIESLLVGVLSSGVGIMLGLLVARGIVGLLSAAGGFPSVELVTSASTVMFAVVLGVGVTFLASLRPALRASRVAPVAAFSAAAATPRSRRPFLGFAGLLLGAAMFATSILLLPGAAPRLALGAVGAALFYASIPALAAVLIGPISRAVVLLRPSSVVASLAAANASRTPRRTSAAASAMIVGLSLVSAVTVVAASVSSTLTTALADHIAGSHVARSEQQGPGGVPREYVADLQETKAFASVVGVRPATVGIGGTGRGVSSVDPEGFTSVFDLEVVQGTMDVSSPFSVALEQSLAESLSLRSGMSVEVTHLNGQAVMWEVVGVFKDPGLLLADVVVSKETMDVEGVPTQNDRYVVAGGPALDIEARLSEFSLVYPQVTLEDLATFQESRSAQIDRLLGVVNALLGLTVLVAAIGIANTLSLTVLERAREIGLLRAVGASRRQVKRMVRLESLLIGVLGGVLGVTVGVGFGILLTRAFPEALAGSVTVPAGRLLVLFVAGALTALGASWWPARRAAASDVVAAVTTD